jgi:hypothetical protein
MPLEYDPHTSRIFFDGREVGTYLAENGIAKVQPQHVVIMLAGRVDGSAQLVWFWLT